MLSGTALSCPTCNTVDKSPFVIDANVLATGGMVGGLSGNGSFTQPPFASSATDAQGSMVAPGPGYLRNMSVNLAAAQATGASVSYSVRVSNIASLVGIASIILTSGQAAGVYREPAVMRVPGATNINHNVNNTVTSSNFTVSGTTPTGWAAEFIMDDGGIMVGGYLNAVVASTTTRYGHIFGTATQQTTQVLAAVPIPIAATAKNLCFTTSTAQSSNNSLVLTLYVNGSATSVVATAAASAAIGIYCDLTHTASITAGQDMSIELKNNANVNSASIKAWSLEVLPTSGTPGILGGGNLGLLSTGVTNFWLPFTVTSNATESNVRIPLPRAGTTTKLCGDNAVNNSSGTVVLTLEKNGSDTAATVTLPTSTAGVTCSSSFSPVSWAQGDAMSLKVVQNACSPCANVSGWSVDY